jgi:hypothetical protein
VDVAAALWGGIIGAIVAATVYAGFLGLRLTRLDLLRFEGGLLVRDRSSMVYIYGVTVQVVAGALLALVYLQVFKGMESASFVGWGALLGLAQGVLAVLLLPVLGMLNRNVRAGDEPRPGQFGRAYGSLTPVALLVASVVFGTWVGIVLIPRAPSTSCGSRSPPTAAPTSRRWPSWWPPWPCSGCWSPWPSGSG